MAESFLIALREGFEAALIVAIVLAFVRRRAPEKAGAVWLGTGIALALSVVVGLVLHVTIDGLEGVARMRTFAAICLAAAALLTWMIFWMRKHARSLKGELEGKAGAAIAEGSTMALAFVAFTAVAREGLETALFLLSTTTSSDGGDVVLGTVLGLAVATALGALVYQGSHLIDMRKFFMVTGLLIILFAAGLLARAVLFLQASGDMGTWNNAVYNLTDYDWLTQSTQSGRFLAGIFGWDPRPSIEQVIAYFGFLLPIGFLYFRGGKPAPAPASPTTPASASTSGASVHSGVAHS
jgi:high-affinity iron transporter